MLFGGGAARDGVGWAGDLSQELGDPIYRVGWLDRLVAGA